ncbi:MAG: MBL fold metallo-hydrolase [Natronomonas sp.]
MDDVHRLQIPTPFDVGRVNCYVFAGEELTLLDPGPDTEAAYEELSTGLERYGFAIDDIDRVVITHPHMDHFGIAGRIVEESGAYSVAHRDATHRLVDPIGHFDHEQTFFRPFLQKMGVPERTAETAVKLPEAYSDYQTPLGVDRKLTDGDSVDVGVELKAIHTPGHAPGSVCFVSAADNTGFTGDHVLGHISPNPLLTLEPGAEDERTRSLPTYLDSLRRMRGGVDIGHAGHGDVVPDLDERIEAIIEHHHSRKERIEDILRKQSGATAYEVMEEMFPDLPATEIFPGMSEVIGHLDLLEDENRVEITEADGVRQYRPR